MEANVSINEESGCDRKVGEVPEEVTLAKIVHINSEIFHDIGSTKIKIVEADPS